MEKIISLKEFSHIPVLFGSYNQNIKLLCKTFNVKIVARDHLKINGEKEAVEKTTEAVTAIQEHIQNKKTINFPKVKEIVARYIGPIQPNVEKVQDIYPAKPRTEGQLKYLRALLKHDIVFAIGPAGTGKTYLAVAMAINALTEGQVNKIVLVRPAVEAGEKLGFLPGSYEAKINPYLRPLYDSLHQLLGYDRLKKYMQKDIIEIAPLAYMRGRTLESAFIILDEAQNTTTTQMKMFLTRLGMYSRVVVTGDTTQIDLPRQFKSGLVEAAKILEGVNGIYFCHLTKADIVRHPLVQRIVAAYERATPNPIRPPKEEKEKTEEEKAKVEEEKAKVEEEREKNS